MGDERQEPLGPTLVEYREEARRQNEEVDELVASLSDDQLFWRAEEGRWSVAQNITHLTLTNRWYLERISSTIDHAREERLFGTPPYRHPWIFRLFLWSMMPSSKLRVKTFGHLEPPRASSRTEVREGFRVTQGEAIRALERARGLDLGRVRMSSPMTRLIRMSLGQAFELFLTHNRRHLRQAREVTEHPEFPLE